MLGPGISIAEAQVSHLDGPLLVRGWLWGSQGGVLRLCTELTRSTPPQCYEPWVTVKGLDSSQFENLRTEGGVTWSEQPALILGMMRNGILEVSSTSKG